MNLLIFRVDYMLLTIQLGTLVIHHWENYKFFCYVFVNTCNKVLSQNYLQQSFFCSLMVQTTESINSRNSMFWNHNWFKDSWKIVRRNIISDVWQNKNKSQWLGKSSWSCQLLHGTELWMVKVLVRIRIRNILLLWSPVFVTFAISWYKALWHPNFWPTVTKQTKPWHHRAAQ